MMSENYRRDWPYEVPFRYCQACNGLIWGVGISFIGHVVIAALWSILA